jgi:hypothetical protein
MPASQLVSAQHGIIAWSKNADGDVARRVVQTATLVRRSMAPTDRGAASNIGQPISTAGVPVTTTLSRVVVPARQRTLLANEHNATEYQTSIWSLRPVWKQLFPIGSVEIY